MENPLTLEEKLSAIRLLGHDWRSHQVDILLQFKEKYNLSKDLLCHKCQHGLDLVDAVTVLSTFTDDCYFSKVNTDEIGPKLEQLKSSFHKKGFDAISYYVNLHNFSFRTHHCLWYSALRNLVKNSLSVIDQKEGTVHIYVSLFRGKIESPIFVPEQSEIQSSSFIRFSVRDNGSGFPEGIPFDHWIQRGTSSRENSGFGLYYVSLVCKFLRSYLTIESKKGDTKVSIYHPTILVD